MEDYSIVVRDYIEALSRTNNSGIKLMYDVASNLYTAMSRHYEYCQEIGNVQQQYRICQLIDEKVLNKLAGGIVNTKSIQLANKLSALHKKFFAMSARRILRNFAFYIEQYKSKRVWDKTADTVAPVFYYADLFNVNKNFNLMRVSLMPSMGKSYIANMFVAQACGNDPNIQLLRITYSDTLCQKTTNQTKGIITSRAFKEIFPRYQGVKKMFKTDTMYQFCMIDNEDEYNLNAVTRDGQSTGLRAQILIIDDLLKDDSESYNVALHKKMEDRYESTWSSRADGDGLKVLLMGTMWANTDLLNIMYERAREKEDLVPSKKFKYTEITKSGSSVFIGIPALDENDHSTCPLRYSDEFLKDKRAHMTKFLWQSVYQQDPIAPEGLSFDWACLQQYDVFPEITYETVRYASLDPARKGKNYVTMPIFYKYGDLFYLRDCLYQKKSMDELYDDIVDRIIQHRLSYLVVENNTDTSLKYVLEEKLRERHYFGCTITEKYSTANKEQRIKDNQGYIRNNIVYPKKGMYSGNTDLGKAMEALVSYSFDYPNKFDDMPDAVALFVMEFIKQTSKPGKAQVFNRKKMLGF